jgi:DNA-binding transcriptional ArsR family regulator
VDTFAALAVPIRRDILEALAREGRLSATEIHGRFKVSFPAISQHLKVLRHAGLVDVERRAQQRIYRIHPAGLAELETWARTVSALWRGRFDALDDALQQEREGKKR